MAFRRVDFLLKKSFVLCVFVRLFTCKIPPEQARLAEMGLRLRYVNDTARSGNSARPRRLFARLTTRLIILTSCSTFCVFFTYNGYCLSQGWSVDRISLLDHRRAVPPLYEA